MFVVFPQFQEKFTQSITVFGRVLFFLFPITLYFKNAPAEVGMSLIAVCFLLYSLVKGDFSWLRSRWVQIGLVFWLYMVLRSLFVEEMESALKRALPWIRYIVFAAALAFWLMKDSNDRKYLFAILGITSLFVLGNVFLQYVTGTDLLGYEKIGDRLTATTGRQNVGTALMLMTMPVVAYLLKYWAFAFKRGSWYKPAITWLYLLTLFVAILITTERMSLLLFLFGFGLLFLIYYRLRAIFAGVVLVGGMVLIFMFSPSLYNRHVEQTVDVFSAFYDSPYGFITETALTMSRNNPIFGVGPKQYRNRCPEYQREDISDYLREHGCSIHAHNIYSEILSELGVIGLFLFLYMIVIWGKFYGRNWSILYQHPFLLGCVAVMFLRIWPLAFTADFYFVTSIAPLWYFLGISQGGIAIEKSEST